MATGKNKDISEFLKRFAETATRLENDKEFRIEAMKKMNDGVKPIDTNASQSLHIKAKK